MWQWEGEGSAPYKNERLAYYQQQLIAQGFTDTEQLKWFSAQLIQENGSFNEAGIYHGNCVFGIPQINACGRFHMSATRYLEKHPEWKDWRYQIEQMAVQTKERSLRFNGELSCTIVAHFHPYTAKGGSLGAADLYKAHGHCKSHQYWKHHVHQRLKLLVPTATASKAVAS